MSLHEDIGDAGLILDRSLSRFTRHVYGNGHEGNDQEDSESGPFHWIALDVETNEE